MKKLISMILVLAMALSLCACSKATNDNDTAIRNPENESQETMAPTETTAPAEPTSEEKTLLTDYVTAVASLNAAATKLQDAPYLHSDNIQRYRQELVAMDLGTVNRWAQTEWAQWAYEQCNAPDTFRFPVDFDCDAVLARFVKVEDVKLTYTRTTTDFLGNVSNPWEETVWDYFADGTIRRVGNEFNSCHFAIEGLDMRTSVFDYHGYNDNLREYDTDGRLTKISYYDTYQRNATVALVRLFTYDAEGKLTTQTAKANNNERVYHYAYDAQGRIAEVEMTYDGGLHTRTYETLYTYDADGNLTKEELTTYNNRSEERHIVNRYIMEYVYDASGKLVSGTYTEQNWNYNIAQGNFLNIQRVDQCTFELDAQGRVVKETVIPGSYLWAKDNTQQFPASYAQIVYETVYGDYYVYTIAE